MRWNNRVQKFGQSVRDYFVTAAVKYAPKPIRDELDRRVEADANRLNALVLESQGFIRCYSCPERFGGGLRARVVDGKKRYFCQAHAKAFDAGTLIIG